MEPPSEQLIVADEGFEGLNLLVAEQWKAEWLKETTGHRREKEVQNAD